MTTPFEPIKDLADILALDNDDVCAGYRDYQKGDPEPGINRGRAYWLGWRNAQHDKSSGAADPVVPFEVIGDYARWLRTEGQKP
jgi:hypothetical protein